MYEVKMLENYSYLDVICSLVILIGLMTEFCWLIRIDGKFFATSKHENAL